MTPEERRDHVRRGLAANVAGFGLGPRWPFAVDVGDTEYVAVVECDLANVHVPRGEANISYSAHPAHRGQGHVSRAVRLLACFLADHTGARRAHLLVDDANTASLRVAAAVGSQATERWIDEAGSSWSRHVLDI